MLSKGEEAPNWQLCGVKKIQASLMGGVRRLNGSSDLLLKTQQSVWVAEDKSERGSSASGIGELSLRLGEATFPRRPSSPL